MSTAIVPPTGIDYQEADVTPELAQKWLGLNTANRPLKSHQVIAYARDMTEGRWVLNGEFIKFAGPAYAPTKLLDGQNRLHAVLRSQATVRMAVAFNVPDTAQESMDSGAKRSVADNLSINSQANAAVVAAAAGLAMRVADGHLTNNATRATNSAIQAFIRANPGFDVSAAIASTYAKRADVPNSVVAYTHWYLAQIDPDAATAFWRDAAEKVGLESGDPVIAMTNRFAEARRNREKLQQAAMLSIIYRAWNYRREGKPLRVSRVNSTRGGLIEIPEPK